MSAPTIAPATESQLLADALTDARTQLAAAQRTNIQDHTALAGSHAALAATVRRLLWIHNAEEAS